jgi:hypothetical protein
VAAYFSNGILEIVNGGRVIFGPFYDGNEKTSWPEGTGGFGEHPGGVFA